MGDIPAAKLTQNSLVKEKVLVGAFSVITNLRMELFEALIIVTACDSYLG